MGQLTIDLKPIIPEELKPYRWITLEEQEDFVHFLENVGVSEYLIDEKLSWCASQFEKYKCQNDSNHSRVTRYIPCGKRGICPRCSMSYAHKRAGIMYQWMKRNLADKLNWDFDLKLNQIVITLPKELHDMDTKIFVKMIKSFMKSFGIEAYGYCVQTRHSKNPLSERYIHAHVLSLNVKQENDKLVKNEYYFDVDKMRLVWKDIIKQFTKYDVVGSVNIHTEYASILHEKQNVLHLLAYVYRYPIQDLFQVQTRDKSINYLEGEQIEKNPNVERKFCVSCYEHIESTDKERLEHCRYRRHRIEDAWDKTTSDNILQFDKATKLRELVNEPKPRLVWCGLLTSAKRKLLQNLIGVGSSLWKNLIEIEKDLNTQAKNCRDCGLPLETEPYERGSYQGDNEPR